jgi:Fe(3+) dicitrate transport protein
MQEEHPEKTGQSRISGLLSSTSEWLKLILTVACMALVGGVFAQGTISGVVTDLNDNVIQDAEVFLLPSAETFATDKRGKFNIPKHKAGDYQLVIFLLGYETVQQPISINNAAIELKIKLKKLEYDLNEVTVSIEKERQYSIRRLRAVEGTSIFAGKKTEVILLDQKVVNTAANNARQIYAQIAGLNIYEGNDAGIQLNIGGRGLDPNRTANFNTRQNGYDISADVLGYPESYYSPPAEALEEIQVIRGAASLQYGTQFGGLVNFKFKSPNPRKKISLVSRQTIGSYDLFTSFNSLSGTLGKFSYYTYFNHKRGKDFRPNSGFQSNNFFAQLNYKFSARTSIKLETTYLKYLAQQAGGLTDAQFYRDPAFSNRSRNWFEVDWRLWAVQLKHKFSSNTDFSWQIFGLDAERNAIGFRTNRVSQTDDLDAPRDLLKSQFQNWGSEARLLHRYSIAGKRAVFLVGSKIYQSNNNSLQGPGSNGMDADFSLQNELFSDYPNQSDFAFPNLNYAFFGEHIFYLTDRFSITPGLRYEYIRTESDGIYRAIDFDLAGNAIRNEVFTDNRVFNRNRLLLGLGMSYTPLENVETYANVSQNYRSVTFNDIRTVNPSYQIDPNITDENGFNADFGIRGQVKNVRFDANVFGLLYNDRLGEVLRPQTRVTAEGATIETGRIVRYRGNIGRAFIYGIESLVEWSAIRPNLETKQYYRLNLFSNLAITNSTYLSSEIAGIKGNQVEFIPLVNLKSGINFGYKNLRTSLQYTFLSDQFSDASNAEQNKVDNQSGIVGTIPFYSVMDFSASFNYKKFRFETGINNLFDNAYFTRRATGYPGPGIIPSAPRTFYLTLGVEL